MKLLLLLLALGGSAHAYKFLCNGVDADGNVESDSCGVCNDVTGPRWKDSAVAYSVNTLQLPASLTASSWVDLAKSSFSSWAGLSGVSLAVTNAVTGNRNFGADPVNHTIFWVNNEQEWMDNVGVAPDGILGVTLPGYVCPTSGNSAREIQDADMILNAVPSSGFDWQPDCPKLTNDCQSIRATLTHELGHFLGLGHPCVDCSYATMSAQAAFLIQYPLFDDAQGIRALYPNGSTGLFGMSCASNTCASDLQCRTQNSNQYCSHLCTEDSGCDNHLLCRSGFCEFASGAAVGAVGLHEDCTTTNCESGLMCIRVDADRSYCFSNCTKDHKADATVCSAAETCHQLKNSQKVPIDLFACIKFASSGGTCSNPTSVCPSGQDCLIGTCQVSDSVTPGDNSAVGSSPVGSSPVGSSPVGASAPSSGGKSGCAQAGLPNEFALLLGLLGILVPRKHRKC